MEASDVPAANRDRLVPTNDHTPPSGCPLAGTDCFHAMSGSPLSRPGGCFVVSTPFLRFLALILLASLGLGAAPAGHAQLGSGYQLVLERPTPDMTLPANGSAVSLSVPWHMQCSSAATAPPVQPGPSMLLFTLDSPEGIELVNTTAPVTFPTCPAEGGVAGTAMLQVRAGPSSPGDVPLAFTLAATVKAGAAAPAVHAEVQGGVVVAWHSSLGAKAPVVQATAGPQKPLEFQVELRNTGNAPMTVRFELVDESSVGAGWRVIMPAPIVVQPGGDGTTATILVATPYHNGANSGQTEFSVRMTPESTKDAAVHGDPVVLTFTPAVNGLYIPGPALPLVLVALLGVALLVSRRRA